MFALARGSTFGPTAFCSFGMGNVIVATFSVLQHLGMIPTTGNALAMLGIGLFCFAYIALARAIAALRTNVAYFLTVLTLIPGAAAATSPSSARRLNHEGPPRRTCCGIRAPGP